MINASVEFIRDWELERGESFFDQFDIINPSFLLGFVFGRCGIEEYQKWFQLAEDNGYYLNSIIPEYEGNEYSEELYRNSLGIICELINESEVHLKRFNDALNEEY